MEDVVSSAVMDAGIKTAITTACQTAVDTCKDGIVAVLPIGLGLMAITCLLYTSDAADE